MTAIARLATFLVIALSGAIVGAHLAGSAGATEAPAATAPEGGWQLVTLVDPADGARHCLALDRFFGRRGGAFLVEVALSPVPGRNAGSTLMLRVPNGADLVAGIGIRRTGGAVVRSEWQSCTPQTCLATAALTARQTANLLAAREISVVYRPLPTAPALEVTVDLAGLRSVWDRAIRCPPEADRP